SGKHVDIHFLLDRGRALRGSRAILLSHFLELIERGLVGEKPFLQPAFLALRRAHAYKALVGHAFEHQQSIAVMHHAGLVVDGGYFVAKRGFRRGDVNELLLARGAAASRQQLNSSDNGKQKASCPWMVPAGVPLWLGIVHGLGSNITSPR